ncbi:uncharacterized protein LDX57_012158 [Aspergillus melleus]|uniref:uncharacterized protein n=1 Tax=Aspergillus melleus TaxID=138277 RepID=UPI001E8EB692|nr:uncharacterized protein LDX57_012158 [Aspergillus melleus]KAH8434515.1 hypothetical protein LDX57_012158 [Aspergillus melleus]
MKHLLLIAGFLVALTAAAPMPPVERRDGNTEFDPDYIFKNKRAENTESDLHYFVKR